MLPKFYWQAGWNRSSCKRDKPKRSVGVHVFQSVHSFWSLRCLQGFVIMGNRKNISLQEQLITDLHGRECPKLNSSEWRKWRHKAYSPLLKSFNCPQQCQPSRNRNICAEAPIGLALEPPTSLQLAVVRQIGEDEALLLFNKHAFPGRTPDKLPWLFGPRRYFSYWQIPSDYLG